MQAKFEIWVEVPEGDDAKLLGAELAGYLAGFDYVDKDNQRIAHKWTMTGPVEES